MIASDDKRVSATRPWRIATGVLDGLSSTWFGVGLLVAILVYSSIGSAVPPIREGALADWLGLEGLRFEKSEVGWFTWWPFQVMVASFCVSMVVATVRRVRLDLVHAGVWMTHLGIVMLAAASAVYFGRKVEGDTVIYQSRAVVRAPGMGEPVMMVVRPGATAQVGTNAKGYEVRVARIDPDYTLLTGQDASKRTTAVWLEVQSSEPQREFVRLLLVGYPGYTEDLVRGAGSWQRAVQLPGGQRLVDRELRIELEADPAAYFYHAGEASGGGTGAVYARLSREDEWAQFRFDGLPRYSARLSAGDEIWAAPDEPLPPLRPLDIAGVAAGDAGRLAGIRLRITDYLPCARLEGRWVASRAELGACPKTLQTDRLEAGPTPGGAGPTPVLGQALNPMIRFRLVGGQEGDEYELLAMDPQRNCVALADGGGARFIWATSSEQRERWVSPPKPKLVVRVGSKGIEQAIDVSSAYGSGPVAIAGSEYAVELRELVPSGLAGGHPAVAVLRVRKGELAFDRLVIAGESSGGRDVDKQFRPLSRPADADLKIEYVDPASPGLVLVGGDDTDVIDVVWSGLAGVEQRGRGLAGEEVAIAEGLAVRIEGVVRDARLEVRPELVGGQRRAALEATGKAGPLIRVEVDDGTSVQRVWLPFDQYAFKDERWAYPGRFGYDPREVVLSDGRRLELLYSRCRDALPSPVALERFILETYPGGDRESDYISQIRLWGGEGWSEVKVVRSNEPLRHGRLWYFQSQWDPGSQAYTVLGVGNREAIGWMLAGVCVSIAGMIWAFYVKPAIERRQREARPRAGLPMKVGVSSRTDEAEAVRV